MHCCLDRKNFNMEKVRNLYDNAGTLSNNAGALLVNARTISNNAGTLCSNIRTPCTNSGTMFLGYHEPMMGYCVTIIQSLVMLGCWGIILTISGNVGMLGDNTDNLW